MALCHNEPACSGTGSAGRGIITNVNGILIYLNQKFPTSFSSAVVLMVAFASMYLSHFVGSPPPFFLLLLPLSDTLHLMLGYVIAYFIFDILIASANKTLSIVISGYVVLVTLVGMSLFVGYAYMTLVAPVIDPISLPIAITAMKFYALLPIIFLVSMFRRMEGSSTRQAVR